MRSSYLLMTIVICCTVSCADPDGSVDSQDRNTEPSEVQCPSASACGGDVVGTWAFTQLCAPMPPPLPPLPQCPTASLRMSPHIAGTVIYGSDGTYSVTKTLAEVLEVNFPGTCLGDRTCDALAQRPRDSASVQTVVCSADVGGCRCELTSSGGEEQPEVGTFTLSEGHILMTSSSGTRRARTYCSQGSQLVEQEGSVTTVAQRIDAISNGAPSEK